MLARKEKGKFGVRHLILPLLLAGAVYFGYNKYLDINLRKANEALLAGDFETAEANFRKVASMPLSKGKGEDGLGILDLLVGDLAGARDHFRVVLSHKPRRMAADPTTIIERFLADGNYHHAQIYVDFLKNWKDEGSLRAHAVDFAAVAMGNHDLDEATRLLESVSPKDQKSERFETLSKQARKFKRDGQIPVLEDRHGNPFLFFDLKTKDYAYASPKVFAGWMKGEAGKAAIEGLGENDRLNLGKTTLDLNLQKAVHHAMRGYKGTAVLTDPSTGEILAAYGTEGYNPFLFTFEPGSVIKLLTYGFFLEEGGDVSPYAPKTYPGNTTIGGKIFYDWTRQGMLKTVDEGMAVSCNLMFAQMGIDLSMGRWLSGIKQIFDGEPKSGYMGEGLYGRLVKDPDDAWELGRASIGLDHLETTTLGLSLIPMSVANKGSLMRPFLMGDVTNIYGQVYKTHEGESMGRLFAEHVAESMASSMEASVTDVRGTARRARVDFVKTGMKTGTSGERPFNSVMVGMFPLRAPKVAFAFVLHEGGKCEINGGRVAKRMQEQIKALAPDYLE